MPAKRLTSKLRSDVPPGPGLRSRDLALAEIRYLSWSDVVSGRDLTGCSGCARSPSGVSQSAFAGACSCVAWRTGGAFPR